MVLPGSRSSYVHAAKWIKQLLVLQDDPSRKRVLPISGKSGIGALLKLHAPSFHGSQSRKSAGIIPHFEKGTRRPRAATFLVRDPDPFGTFLEQDPSELHEGGLDGRILLGSMQQCPENSAMFEGLEKLDINLFFARNALLIHQFRWPELKRGKATRRPLGPRPELHHCQRPHRDDCKVAD